MRYVLGLDEAAATELELTGGKGASLARLMQAGFPVPPGIVVTCDAYRAVIGDAAVGTAFDFARPEKLREQCAALRERLLAIPLPAELRDAILARLPALPVAARSSSTMEDLAGAAFAGQHDTYLDLATDEEVLDGVHRCFASLWEDRAVRYRHEQGLDQQAADMAVVVQSMVPAESAGVAFCLDPVSGELDRLVVDAAPGLGEKVVSGETEIDRFVIDKATGRVLEHRPGPGSEPPLDALHDLCRKVERFHGFPQDIEWAATPDGLHLLQSRPVTSFPARWTRSESAERFPNPITPLTWDFTVDGFHESLAHSLELLGMPRFHGRWFERFDGYIYGNDTAVALFTAGQQAAFDDLEELRALVPVLRARYHWVQQLPVSWARDLDGYLLALGALRAVRLETLADAGLWEHLDSVDVLGREYFLPNIAISITQGVLHRVLYRLLTLVVPPEEASGLHDDLTCFCDTKTAVVNRDLHRLYVAARDDESLAKRIAEDDLRTVPIEEHPGFAARLEWFLDRHGHREVDFDPYHPTWEGRPWVVLSHVRHLLLASSVPEPRERERSLRIRQREAEERFFATAPEDLRFFSSEILRLARIYTALDDLEHYQTTRLHPLFRACVVEAGRRLALDRPEHAFFLRKDSLRRALLGDEAVRTAVRDEARAGKAAYDEQAATEPPWEHGAAVEAPAPGSVALHGLPGSPGVAEGPVCRILSVEDFPDFPEGAVLVTRTTNPAWTPLFYAARALVAESGGPLSHGAVTAREVGLPAVMGVRGALAQLQQGTMVRVNGTAGTVEVLE